MRKTKETPLYEAAAILGARGGRKHRDPLSTYEAEQIKEAARAMGEAGGAKGGLKRAANLSKEELSDIGFYGSVKARQARGIEISSEDMKKMKIVTRRIEERKSARERAKAGLNCSSR